MKNCFSEILIALNICDRWAISTINNAYSVLSHINIRLGLSTPSVCRTVGNTALFFISSSTTDQIDQEDKREGLKGFFSLKGNTSMKFVLLFCRNRILMVSSACNKRFLKIIIDSAKIFNFLTFPPWLGER
jgi:hypothetical protein